MTNNSAIYFLILQTPYVVRDVKIITDFNKKETFHHSPYDQYDRAQILGHFTVVKRVIERS